MNLWLDDDIQDSYQQIYGKAATADTLTYLQCEIMQAVWWLLLDNDFVDAYAMESLLNFLMEWNDVSFCDFSHIQLITPRSEFWL